MINLKQELVNFAPVNMESLAGSGAAIPDNVRNAVILYNKAIDSIRIGSEDIAVIELKKAIAMYPDFHEAMNLLGLCYSYAREFGKASELFGKVMDAEKNSLMAKGYLDMLNGKENIQPAPAGRKKAVSGAPAGASAASAAPSSSDADSRTDAAVKLRQGSKPISNPTKGSIARQFSEKGKKPLVTALFKYAAGFLAGIVVLGLVLVIFINGRQPDQKSQDKGTINGVTPGTSYKDAYEKLKAQYNKLKQEADTTESRLDYYKNIVKLYSIENLYTEKKYETAADELILLKTVEFRDTEKNRFTELYGRVLPEAAKSVYEEGVNLHNSKKYSEALDKLNKVMIYGTEWEFMNGVYYYIGKCHMYMNDYANAKAAFRKVIDDFPQSKYAGWSQSWIDDMDNAPQQ